MRNLESHALVVLVRSGAELGRWPLVGPWQPDLQMVDELARSQLAVHRLGCSLQLHQVRPELRSLLALLGLASTIPCVDLVLLKRALPAPDTGTARWADAGMRPRLEGLHPAEHCSGLRLVRSDENRVAPPS